MGMVMGVVREEMPSHVVLYKAAAFELRRRRQVGRSEQRQLTVHAGTAPAALLPYDPHADESLSRRHMKSPLHACISACPLHWCLWSSSKLAIRQDPDDGAGSHRTGSHPHDGTRAGSRWRRGGGRHDVVCPACVQVLEGRGRPRADQPEHQAAAASGARAGRARLHLEFPCGEPAIEQTCLTPESSTPRMRPSRGTSPSWLRRIGHVRTSRSSSTTWSATGGTRRSGPPRARWIGRLLVTMRRSFCPS
eukprot:2867869-Prymnesium_polylepis.1